MVRQEGIVGKNVECAEEGSEKCVGIWTSVGMEATGMVGEL